MDIDRSAGIESRALLVIGMTVLMGLTIVGLGVMWLGSSLGNGNGSGSLPVQTTDTVSAGDTAGLLAEFIGSDSWSSGGLTYTKWDLTIINNGSEAVSSWEFTVPARSSSSAVVKSNAAGSTTADIVTGSIKSSAAGSTTAESASVSIKSSAAGSTNANAASGGIKSSAAGSTSTDTAKGSIKSNAAGSTTAASAFENSIDLKEAVLNGYWNCEMEITDSGLAFRNKEYNGVIPAGGRAEGIGFILGAPAGTCDLAGTWNITSGTAVASKGAGANSGSGGAADSFNYNEDQTAGASDTGTDGSVSYNGSTSGSTGSASQNTGGSTAAGNTGSTSGTTGTTATQSGTPYALHGALAVKGTHLVDSSGKQFKLKGVSTHGIAWYPQYVNKAAFKTLRDDWGANVVRLASYSAEYGGWCSGGDRIQLAKTIDTGVNAATDLGMYVIIDWHILSDGDPNTHKSDAKAFFSQMSSKYADRSNVLYEICNEPNGCSWDRVRTYANEVIPVIRANDPDAIIIVGTPTWSQDVDQVAAAPVAQPANVMYALHFYAATHKDSIRNKAIAALSAGTPLFVTEFSICDASGSGSIDYDSAAAWKSLIDKYGISYCAWSLCNKAETASLLASGTSATSGWSTSDLSDTGRWLRNWMRG